MCRFGVCFVLFVCFLKASTASFLSESKLALSAKRILKIYLSFSPLLQNFSEQRLQSLLKIFFFSFFHASSCQK